MPSVGTFLPSETIAEIMTEFHKVDIVSVPITINKNRAEVEIWVTLDRFDEAMDIVTGIIEEHPEENVQLASYSGRSPKSKNRISDI